MLLTLPFAHQLCAGDRAARIRDQRARRAGGDLGRQRVHRAPRRGLDATMGEFLDAVADPQLQVPPAGVRCGLAEHDPPLPLQLGHCHRLQRGQFGQDIDPRRLACGRGFHA